MSYNEQLRAKLKSNFYGVGFFFVIGLLLLGTKLYQMYGASPTLFEVQNKLIGVDYVPFIYVGYGLLAFIASFLVYKFFDNFLPHHQIILFMGVGILFLPFTLILCVIGIMKYMEKNTFHKSFYLSSIFALLFLALWTGLSTQTLAQITPEYMNEYSYVLRYEIDADHVFDIEVTAVSRFSELEKVTFKVTMSIDDPTGPLVAGEFYRLSVSGNNLSPARTCVDIPVEQAYDNFVFECEITEFTGIYQYMERDQFATLKEFYFEWGEVQLDPFLGGISDIVVMGGDAMEIVSATYDYNTYDDEEAIPIIN